MQVLTSYRAVLGVLRGKLHEALMLLEYVFKAYPGVNEIDLNLMHAG